jgi:phosphate transport system substrate-binding protein
VYRVIRLARHLSLLTATAHLVYDQSNSLDNFLRGELPVYIARSLFALLAALSLLSTGAAEDSPPADTLTPEQIDLEINRVQTAIEKLEFSPDAPAAWKEKQKVDAELQRLKDKFWSEELDLSGKSQDFDNDPQVREFSDKIANLTKQLNLLELAKRRAILDAGVRLFRARHAELAKEALKETPKLHALNFNVLNFPHIDGSTSTQPLAVLIASHCFGAPYKWEGAGQSRPDRSDSGNPFFLRSFYQQQEPEAELMEFSLKATAGGTASERLALIINHLLATNASTNQAYLNLVEGRSEIGLLARSPSEEELAFAKSKGVELDVIPCALDAFVFLKNKDNPIRNLTTQQIRDIYTRKIKDWKELGRDAGHIIPYQREESSGSQQLMKTLVMKDTPIVNPRTIGLPPRLIGRLMSSVFLELTSKPDGIACSVYYYERFMSGSPNTRTIAIDGVEPTSENIASRKYPHISEVYVVTRKEQNNDSSAAKLKAWLLSDEGQAVVGESGYVPVASIKPE